MKNPSRTFSTFSNYGGAGSKSQYVWFCGLGFEKGNILINISAQVNYFSKKIINFLFRI